MFQTPQGTGTLARGLSTRPHGQVSWTLTTANSTTAHLSSVRILAPCELHPSWFCWSRLVERSGVVGAINFSCCNVASVVTQENCILWTVCLRSLCSSQWLLRGTFSSLSSSPSSLPFGHSLCLPLARHEPKVSGTHSKHGSRGVHSELHAITNTISRSGGRMPVNRSAMLYVLHYFSFITRHSFSTSRCSSAVALRAVEHTHCIHLYVHKHVRLSCERPCHHRLNLCTRHVDTLPPC